MSDPIWSDTLYFNFSDETVAQSKLASAGLVQPDSLTVIDTTTCALVAPVLGWTTPPVYGAYGAIVTPGTPTAGFTAMLRLNQDWEGYAATFAALQPYRQQPARPGQVFA